ncbi:MAG: peptidylprolyl isomerase [Deltaproteobacteria bacterium]|jgi:peptidyl-prolyl cis-trans isomerase C|nr:peptidylprolyl isomerase [Deltaproteobacteria bacterium]
MPKARVLPTILAPLLLLFFLGCGGDEAATPAGGAEPPAAPAAEAPAADAPAEAPAEAQFPAASADLPEDGEAAVALVNGEPVTKKNLDSQLAFGTEDSPFDEQGDGAPPPEPSLEQRVLMLDILIRLELAVQEAYRLGFEPKGEELDRLVDEAIEAYGGKEELQDALEANGETIDDFRDQVQRNVALRNWRDTAFLGKALVTDEEAKAFYDQHLEEATHGEEVRAMQLMFPIPFAEAGDGTQTNRIREKAKEALELAKSGMDFEELIPRYMDQTTLSATNRGQMGWLSRGATFPQLEEALFSMKPGEVSEILETPFSLHILKVVDTRPPGIIPYQQLKPDIMLMLSEHKTDQLVNERMDELMAEAQVEVLDPELSKAWQEFRQAGAKAGGAPEPAMSQGD